MKQYERAAQMKALGKTTAEIAAQLKVKQQAVYGFLHIAKKRGFRPAKLQRPVGSPDGKANESAPDIRSAIIYLRQARGKSPRYAAVLAELALLTLLGEDR
jgi:hypothetical protein